MVLHSCQNMGVIYIYFMLLWQAERKKSASKKTCEQAKWTCLFSMRERERGESESLCIQNN
jgi:hypothetical protein